MLLPLYTKWIDYEIKASLFSKGLFPASVLNAISLCAMLLAVNDCSCCFCFLFRYPVICDFGDATKLLILLAGWSSLRCGFIFLAFAAFNRDTVLPDANRLFCIGISAPPTETTPSSSASLSRSKSADKGDWSRVQLKVLLLRGVPTLVLCISLALDSLSLRFC